MQRKKHRPEKRSYPIIVLSAFYSVLFGLLLIYICHYAYNNKQELLNNSYNTRQQILLAQNTRGKILSRDGDVLAYTTADENGKEKRVYPFGKEFAHVVGYSTNGKAGLESNYNYYLINTNIELQEKAKLEEKKLKFPGDNVYTTLDVKLQEVAYNALSARKGAIVATNPKTGEILALVSKPDFDPNTISEDWNSLLADTSTDAKLLNRATQGLYPPGSTFKIVTSLAYIKEHPEDYKNYRYSCNGRFSYEDETIKCFHGENHGNVDFISSFAKSCNSSYANMGISIEKKIFKTTISDLMFNSELPLSMNYSKSSVDIKLDTKTSDVMQISIGQGSTQVTPIHMNMITDAIANDGVLMKPYLVSSIKSDSGKVVKAFSDERYKRLLSEKEAEILQGMMEQVVLSGTASKLKDLSYTAAGKTGSAEFTDSTSDSHAWFTGYAPAEDPEICVTIIVENAGSGGSYAVPIAKRIFDAYFGVE
ncbi:peptidoglycan D,D-transpeptidase FtsI family protein [Butyrivibrio sp. YAB3001]|uniref:peptidoglycan D,D-transpeptidase FtsI family protein n=1 Tax=Butyrivibrio sp. YAB3001 TaxID=1520812 RepID=UPI0008F6800E|nr:penicillin-binding transpeptidase domain-containing protein [Butyrivibrio sp. YAB3001]SFC35809.1 peptidoglycan glycosyltransferase [Butyrivibrio sp. YAB3001]